MFVLKGGVLAHFDSVLLVLWPLFHYIVWTSATDGRAEKQFWADYVAVNQQFADTIVAHYRPGDISK